MIAALLLAAGESTRMGRPKLALPWGEGETLIGHMVKQFRSAGVDSVLVVTGGDREAVEAALKGAPAQRVHNRDYRSGGMIASIKAGLRELQQGDYQAAMITPADLPHLQVMTIQALLQSWQAGEGGILAPSYQARRGHPIVIERRIWPQLLALPQGKTLRDFMRIHSQAIAYREVDDSGVLQDLDTPEDYQRARPG